MQTVQIQMMSATESVMHYMNDEQSAETSSVLEYVV